MCNFSFETLESRTLLAGVTIIANTWDSGLGTYVEGTDNNMIARIGAQNDPQYTISIGADPTTNALEIGEVGPDCQQSWRDHDPGPVQG